MLPDELFPLFSSSRGQRIYIDWNPEEEKEEPMSVHCLHTTLIDLKKNYSKKEHMKRKSFPIQHQYTKVPCLNAEPLSFQTQRQICFMLFHAIPSVYIK